MTSDREGAETRQGGMCDQRSMTTNAKPEATCLSVEAHSAHIVTCVCLDRRVDLRECGPKAAAGRAGR
jgi:hypothetical protein